MAHAKIFLFTDEEQRFSAYCKAMGHPARWRIINALRDGRVMEIRDLARDIPLAPATIQNHVIRLERVFLIKLNHDIECQSGYQIVPEILEDMSRLMVEFGGGS